MDTRDGEQSRDKAAVKRVGRIFLKLLQCLSDRAAPMLAVDVLNDSNLLLVSCQACHLDYQGSLLGLIVVFGRTYFPPDSWSYILYQPFCEHRKCISESVREIRVEGIKSLGNL